MEKGKKKIGFSKNVIAMVYDFDGTLTPQPMQEYTLLPNMEKEPKEFWAEVKTETEATGSDELLTYMRLLIKYAKQSENKKRCQTRSQAVEI